MDTLQALRQRLASLEPDTLELYDDSHEHAGHAGAQGGGGHYQLLVVSRHFDGLSAVARHRMVYGAVGDMMRREVHALAIKAYTPEELARLFPH